MKHFLALVLISTIVSCTYFKRDDAVKYNNKVIDLQTRILQQMDTFSGTFESGDSAMMYQGLQNLNLTIDSCLSAMKNLEPFDGDATLRDAGMNLFTFYQKTAQQEYPKLLHILNKEDPDTTDQTKIDEINAMVSKEEESLDEAMRTAQNALASKYHFELDSNQKKNL